MRQYLVARYSLPFVALGGLVAFSCVASMWYINRLQDDLARAIRHDAVQLAAADSLQIQLRHLRVHSLILFADRSDARWRVVRADLAGVEAALEAIREQDTVSEDSPLIDQIEGDYAAYRKQLDLEHLPPPGGSAAELARWSDEHHMENLLAPCRELATRQHHRMEVSLERSRTQTAWAGRLLLALGFIGAGGGVLAGYATARRLQEQGRHLHRAEQLAAVGRLAAGVAHEVRNPLTGIKVLVEAALQPTNPSPLNEEDLKLIGNEIVRMERTVQELLDYARTPPPDRRPHDVREIVVEAVAAVRSRAEQKRIATPAQLPAAAVTAEVDRDQMVSLFTNLLLNAIEASEPGGEVVIRAADDGGKLVVEVADRGPGIDPAMESRLFTPFATSKPTGTGLGLSVARRIAQDHGGTLTAENRPEGGAKMTLTIPESA
jgi:signal transduction histidine kinase